MALRFWPDECLDPIEAQARLRGASQAAIEPLLTSPIQVVLDLGCSVVESTQALSLWL